MGWATRLPGPWSWLVARQGSAPERLWLLVEADTTLVKGAAVLCALGLFGWGAWLERSGRAGRWRWTRRCALLLLAFVAFAAYCNFFAWRRNLGNVHDAFHYYLNSKYFAELGYFELYECAFLAIAERERGLDARTLRIRDLRTNQMRAPLEIVPRTPRCGGAFSKQRWIQFKTDVGWFQDRLGEPGWRNVLGDFGYNPTPVWTMVGGSLASLFPANDASMRRLFSLDLVLLLLAFSAIGWAFGFEAFCLGVLTWSANPLNSYFWTGDAFLRHLWFASAMLALCLLRKGRPGMAGALLALSSLLRLFPVFFALGYGLQHGWRWIRTRRLDAGFRRFVVSAAVTSVLLLVLAGAVTGRGVGAYLEFEENIGRWSQLTANNSFGLRPLVAYKRPASDEGRLSEAVATRRWIRERERVFTSRLPVFLAVCAVFAGLFWRALLRVADWEAAAMGVTLVCVVLQPPNYYMSCLVAVALLAAGRRRIGVGLLLLLLGFNLSHFYLFTTTWRTEFAVSSALALVFFAYLLWELGRRPVASGARSVGGSAGLGSTA